MPAQSLILTQDPDDAFDLVCMECGGSSRIHPDESFVDQVRLFLDAHRHRARTLK